jgi:hypothetical protein
MGGFDGVGKVFRTELNPQPERHPQIDRAERDKRGKGQDQHREEPHDSVELHEEDAAPAAEKSSPRQKPKDRKLDISA